MNNSDYKVKLYDIIMSGKGLQYVMDACAQLIGNPFVFSNQSLQIICKSSSCDQFPEVFGWVDGSENESFQYAHEAAMAGYFKAIYASDSPVYGTVSGISANWVAARVRFKEKIIGSILAADCQTPFSEQYEELLPLICQAIAFSLLQTSERDYGFQRHAPLFMELLEGKINSDIDEKAIRSHFKLLQAALPQKMRILVLRPADTEHLVNLRFLDTQILSQFPSSVGILYKSDCVRIIDGTLTPENIEERLVKFFYMDHVICGISRSFTSPLAIHDAYQQADAAIRLSRNSKQGMFHRFDDVTGPYLLEQVEAAKNMSANGVIVPEILLLRDLDESEGAERMQDLAAYLSCGRNTTRTAELRGVHKNSMYYRLNKISELTGLDLNSDDICVQLTISLCLLGYLPFE